VFYSKVEDNVTVTIHLDHVLEFSVGDSGDSVGERCRKFQREADASLTHETEVIHSAEICGEIKRVQSVFVSISSRLMYSLSSLQSLPVPANMLL